MIQSILRFLWRRDSESAAILAIELGRYLNDADLALVGRLYHRVARSEEEHRWNAVWLQLTSVTVVWFWFQRSSENAMWITHCLTGYIPPKDVRQMGDYYTALVENRKRQ